MKTVIADSVALGREAFAGVTEYRLVPEADISPAAVRDADAVVTRSKTLLSRCLFEGSRVRFAGTCTAGTDHADAEALAELGITFAHAPGCNANAVSEYVLAALLELGVPVRGSTIGIVGHGEVGTRVDRKFTALGCRVLRNDPPKAEAGGAGPYVDLETLLRESDVVTLHVPLVERGRHPTRNLLSRARIASMRSGAVLVNACRGEAMDGRAALEARLSGRLSGLVLDVWDPEPDLPFDLLAAADLATPHIAGHSVEGKVNGTRHIRERLVRAFALDVPDWDPEPLMPRPEQPEVVCSDLAACRTLGVPAANPPDLARIPADFCQIVMLCSANPPKSCHKRIEFSLRNPKSDRLLGAFEERLRTCVRACYDIRRDDRDLREGDATELSERFTRLRRTYRHRREFAATRILGMRQEETPVFEALGFAV